MYAPRGLPLIPRASLAAALDMFAAARDFEHAYGYGLVLDEAVAVGCRCGFRGLLRPVQNLSIGRRFASQSLC
jgi:hypothetical protein